ncbi:MAG TPA: hypothetical protein PLW66_04360 [Saprospiraceae bacterium]|nr:hypothetical protein [Saprospiraceae bacterium]
MIIRILVCCTACFLLEPVAAQAQRFREHPPAEEPRNKGNAILLHLSGGFQLPGGDLANRFGNNGGIGGGLEWISAGNWALGLETQLLFGQDVKEDPLKILRTPEGDIIGNDRTVASVSLRERGIYFGGEVGRLFTFKKDSRSGIRLTLGAGWLQHHIRVQDDTRTVTQLTGDYLKGYDRRCAGPAFNQFVGWQSLAANRRSNWMIGFEFNQGFTETRRDWDFNDMRRLDGKRIDLRFGIRATWTLPFYFGAPEKIFYCPR